MDKEKPNNNSNVVPLKTGKTLLPGVTPGQILEQGAPLKDGIATPVPAAQKAPTPLEISAQYLRAQFFGEGFALVIFPIGKPGVINMIANTSNVGVVHALKTMANSLEKQAAKDGQ